MFWHLTEGGSVSPILLRPIREQFEHNRMIRLLQNRLRRRYVVGVNIEDEREATGVRCGTDLVYPDLVLTSTTGARRLHGIVEVETAESVNPLEAMAEWTHFGKVRGAFYLYVPAGTTDIAQNLCERYGIAVTEIWSYHAVGDQMRFTMTHRSTRAASRAAAARRVTEAGKKMAKGARRVRKTAKRSAKTDRRTNATPKRATKTGGRTAKTAQRKASARSGRSIAKQPVAKAARTTKKTVRGAKRRAASGGKVASRASTSSSRTASKTRRRSTAAGTQTRVASRRLRKQR